MWGQGTAEGYLRARLSSRELCWLCVARSIPRLRSAGYQDSDRSAGTRTDHSADKEPQRGPYSRSTAAPTPAPAKPPAKKPRIPIATPAVTRCATRVPGEYARIAPCFDGEIVCRCDRLQSFYDLLFRREWPYFLAFDALAIDGGDLRALPLVERKRRLARIMPRIESRLMVLDAIPARGTCLYELACERDLEGIVAKWAAEPISAISIVADDRLVQRRALEVDLRRSAWRSVGPLSLLLRGPYSR